MAARTALHASHTLASRGLRCHLIGDGVLTALRPVTLPSPDPWLLSPVLVTRHATCCLLTVGLLGRLSVPPGRGVWLLRC